jgi:hypothetical protein
MGAKKSGSQSGCGLAVHVPIHLRLSAACRGEVEATNPVTSTMAATHRKTCLGHGRIVAANRSLLVAIVSLSTELSARNFMVEEGPEGQDASEGSKGVVADCLERERNTQVLKEEEKPSDQSSLMME